jgi:putative ABC transport system permease protein
MRVVRRLLGGFRALLRRQAADEELEDELRQFVDAAIAENLARGLSRSDAERAARLQLGSPAAVKDHVRDAGWETVLEQLARDVKYAWRGLWRSPAYAATTAVTLAAGLGLVAVVFTVFDAYVLRPFAIRDPQNLYEVHWQGQEAAGHTFQWRDYEAVRARTDLFESAFVDDPRFVSSGGATLTVVFVSGNYFDTLGAPILLGRGLSEFDAPSPGDAPVAVLSHQLWTRRFKQDPAVIGRDIILNDRHLTIVGVTRAEFLGVGDTPVDAWVPLTMYTRVLGQDLFGAKQPRELRLLVRLHPGATAAAAEGAATVEPFETRVVGRIDPVRLVLQPRSTRIPLTLDVLVFMAPLFAAFALVLVAACANASNVMLARANARHREIGVRLALGASRGRVVRQLLTEGFLIAAIAGAAGLCLAAVILRAGAPLVVATLPAAVSPLVRIVPLDFDRRVFLFALAAVSATTLLFALLPAVHATRLTLIDAIRGQAGSTLRSATLRSTLVGGQVAISLALLVIAATLVRNSAAIGHADLGFKPGNVLAVRQRGKSSLIARAGTILPGDPQVEQVVFTSHNPLFGNGPKGFVREARAIVPVSYVFVSPGYFSMLDIPIVHGRGFRAEEANEQSGVAILSVAAAQALWPGEEAVGKAMRLQLPEPQTGVADVLTRSLRRVDDNAAGAIVLTVVGVAKDVVSGFVYEGKDTAQVYLPTNAEGAHAAALLVQPRAGARLQPDPFHSTLLQLHPDPLKFETLPLADMMTLQMFPLRLASWIGSLLGLVALALSMSGVYGVLTFILGQRAHELAIRMALGAAAPAVVRLVMGQSARLAGVGALCGLFFAFVVMKLLSGVVRLEEVSVLDPGAFAAGLVLITAAVALASFAPARRSTRVDPARMLKADD